MRSIRASAVPWPRPVRKSDTGGLTTTTVDALDEQARQEEIARMLSGAVITDEARAAARTLIG